MAIARGGGAELSSAFPAPLSRLPAQQSASAQPPYMTVSKPVPIVCVAQEKPFFLCRICRAIISSVFFFLSFSSNEQVVDSGDRYIDSENV
jgi:hypothetical protein